MLRIRFAVLGMLVFTAGISMQGATAPIKQPLQFHDALVEKNFYVLAKFKSERAVAAALEAQPSLKAITLGRERFIERSLKSCRKNVTCLVNSVGWTDEEIHDVSRALRQAYSTSSALQKLAKEVIPASGLRILDQSLAPEDLLVNAWEDSARGLNNILSVYGAGTAPRFAKIDSISIDPNSAEIKDHVLNVVKQAASDSKPFFEPTLDVAVELLKMNHRDEAARFEPLQEENKAALHHIPSIDWRRYEYSSILVPGWGPEETGVPLSPEGLVVTKMAAERYHAGKAPLIIVSGGYVHPSQTPYCEAIEMKKALMEQFHVPEEAILIEPHARHTTTNLRNAARLIYRYGIPMSQKALVTTGNSQLEVIVSQTFVERCQRELGYVPYTAMKKLSDTDAEYLYSIESLHADAIDPLDP